MLAILGGTEVYFAMTVIGLAMSAYGYILAQQKRRSPLTDDGSNTIVERGAFIPNVVGRFRIGPNILWVKGGGSGPQMFGPGGVGTDGGKRGGGASGQKGYAWHGLCIGPASRIRRIWINGIEAVSGVITPDSLSSGSSLKLPDNSTFRVYWGEQDQPLNTDPLLTSSAGIKGGAVPSRFPYLCSIVWDPISLGNVAQHPLIEYEVDVQPHGSQLKQSAGWLNTQVSDPGSGANLPTDNQNSPTGRKFHIAGQHSGLFVTQYVCRLSGTEALRIYGKSQVYCDVIRAQDITTPFGWMTEVVVGDETTRTVLNQIVQAGDYAASVPATDDDGVNPAHAIYHLLFSPAPWGCALDPDEWDIDSLEALGVLFQEENVRGDVIVQSGDTAAAAISQLMQDLSFGIALNYETGKMTFVSFREPSGTLPNIGNELICPPLPAIETLHNRAPADQIVFVFRDRTQNYRDMTLLASNDGRVVATQQQRTQKVEISTTTHFGTALKIAYRRAQEELANPSTVQTNVQRDGRYLMAGRAYTQSAAPGILRLMTTKLNTTSPQATHKSVLDVYGLPSPNDETILEVVGNSHDGSTRSSVTPYPDLAVGLFEVPRLVEDEETKVVVVRARYDDTVSSAHIWLSVDGDSYVRAATDTEVHTAFALSDDLPASRLTTSVEAEAIGSDTQDVVEDLTGNESSWRMGRQVALCGDELMYLRSADALGGGSFTLSNLVRGRMGTPASAHAAGDTVFVTQEHRLLRLTSPYFQPGRTVYVKVQPVTASGEMDLTLCEALTITLQDLAWTPLAPVCLTTKNRRDCWRAGDPIYLQWRYFSTEWPRTGAGMQDAGAPTPSASPVQGEFLIELYVVGDTDPTASFTSPVPQLVVEQSQLTDPDSFGSEPTEMLVKVYNVFAGHRSAAAEVTLQRIG